MLCQQCFKAQSLGRRRGGGSGGFTPSQGHHLGRSWWPFLASVPARGTALSSHLAGQPSKTQERRRQNRFTTKGSKASIRKIFSSLFLKGSQKSAFTEPLCVDLKPNHFQQQRLRSPTRLPTPEPGCRTFGTSFIWVAQRPGFILSLFLFFISGERAEVGARRAKQKHYVFLKLIYRNGQATGAF